MAQDGDDVCSLKKSIIDHVRYTQGKNERTASALDRFFAVANTVRDRLTENWLATQERQEKSGAKQVNYLSLEFLMGRALENNLINLGLRDEMERALEGIGLNLSDVLNQEPDAGLGNGGLGRLAACFLDSMATLALPAYGYGIRYEFGIFDQEINDGWQVEKPEEWLRHGNPWEMHRPERAVNFKLYGRVLKYFDTHGKFCVEWVDARTVIGSPYDVPIAGYRNGVVNTLRLWRARACKEFDFNDFNSGDYFAAVKDKTISENISKVLYPNDVTMLGKELRLQQQYMFVACSIHDIISRHLERYGTLLNFSEKVAIQLNDTHPAIAVAELMRVLLDEHGFEWDAAWKMCNDTFGYTNHTLLPEALERWSVDMLGRMLPRHMDIIYEINTRFLNWMRDVKHADGATLSRMSIIEEGPVKYVRMANLAVIGSHSVNGVAELHTTLLREELFRDFCLVWPEKFNSKTNGVTPRRWLLQSNPELAKFITDLIGSKWVTDADELRKLESCNMFRVRKKLQDIKRENKIKLAKIIKEENGIDVNVDSIFDVQVKRLHEYKRQLLNVVHIIHQYLRMKHDKGYNPTPRTFIFGAKAAPGYAMAKWVIKLINSVAEVVNNDPDVNDKLTVVFLKNYRVSLAEKIFPASDVSEQISTAGMEASGTGNMKFALNGALTVGTLDGANVEIRREVGRDNFYLFGLTVEKVNELKYYGYDPGRFCTRELHDAIQAIENGMFSHGVRGYFKCITDALTKSDTYMISADFDSYLRIQERISNDYKNQDEWANKALMNIARSGKFSSDRTIMEYAKEIWDVHAV